MRVGQPTERRRRIRRGGLSAVFRKASLAWLPVLWLGLTLGSFPLVLGAELDDVEVRSLYREGEGLFRQANEVSATDADEALELYRKALLRFERIVREGGVENGKLYYNIGNTYFRLGDVGNAILNYRRAERYVPNDPNLHQNLEFARARRLDHVELKQRTRILRTLFFWHYDFSLRARAMLFTAAFALVWILSAVRLYHRRTFLNYALAGCGALAALMLASILVEEQLRQRTRPGVILSEEAIAREGDSRTYAPSFREPLHAGTEFVLLEDRADWLYVELADGQRGWVPAHDAGLVRP